MGNRLEFVMPRSRTEQAARMRRRYDDYKRLCEHLAVEPQWERWTKHHRELQFTETGGRLTREQLEQWWLDRFTLDEIREMAGAIEWLTIEEAA